MDNYYSEYLLCAGEALYVADVGFIGQYHSYDDMRWEKGIPYFVRDALSALHEETKNRELLPTIAAINSEILHYTKMDPPPVVRQKASRWADDDEWTEPKRSLKLARTCSLPDVPIPCKNPYDVLSCPGGSEQVPPTAFPKRAVSFAHVQAPLASSPMQMPVPRRQPSNLAFQP